MANAKKVTASKKANASKTITASNGVTLTHGTVAVVIPEHLAVPKEAGHLSPAEVKRIARAPHGIGLIADQVADVAAKMGDGFDLPRGVTPETLRAKGKRAEDIDNVILDVEVILEQLKQANLLFDADAWAELRKVNDQVKAQGKHNKQVLAAFAPLVEFMSKGPKAPKDPKGGGK